MKTEPPLQRWLAPLYARAAFPMLRRIDPVQPLAVYYHIVSDGEVPHVGPLYTFRNVTQFTRDLDLFASRYRPIALQEFLACRKQGTPLPKNALLLTFDDGLRECHEVIAPILKRKGIPAAFFLCSAFVDNRAWAFDFKKSVIAGALARKCLRPGETDCLWQLLESVGLRGTNLGKSLLEIDYTRRSVLEPIAALLGCDLDTYLKNARPYLTSDQVRDLLRDGHAIGAHSIDHARYGDIPLAEQLRQTRESVRFVKKRFALPYGALAFPSSDAGVGQHFFEEIGGEVDIFFGNRGLLDDTVPNCIQRTTMEKTARPAESVLGESYTRRFIKRAMGQLTVRRS